MSEPTAATGWKTNVCGGTHTITTSASQGPPRLAGWAGRQWPALPSAGWRCWGSDSGSAGPGRGPYSGPDITRPLPSLHLPPAPAPRPRRPRQPQLLPQQGGNVFLHIREREGAATTTTAHGPRASRQRQQQHQHQQRHQQHPAPTTKPFPHEPNLSRLESSTVDPGLARASFSTSGIQSRAAADELGPHSAFLASWRANLRVNPDCQPRAVPRPICCWHGAASNRVVLVLGIFPLTARASNLRRAWGACPGQKPANPRARWVVRRPAGTATPAGSDE